MPAASALYGQVFGADALELWSRRWKWQFVDAPGAAQCPARLWVAELNGALVGLLASYPARLCVQGREMPVLYACDLLVDRAAAGFGLGLQLIRAYSEESSSPLAVAFQYSRGNELIHDRLQYSRLPIQPVLLRPYRLGAMAKSWLSEQSRAWHVLRPLLPAAELTAAGVRSLRRPRPSRRVSIEHITQPGSEFDCLWQELRREFEVVPVRDTAWIAWRYHADPLTRHQVLLGRDKDGRAVGYTAVSWTRRRGLRIGRIMDLFASPRRPDVIRTLLAAAISALEEGNPDVIACMGLHPAVRRVASRYLLRANRLEQPARVQWSGDPAAERLVLDPDAWHLSYADGDEAFT